MNTKRPRGREFFVDHGRVSCPLRTRQGENIENCLSCAYLVSVAQVDGHATSIRCDVPRLDALSPNFH